MTQPWTITPDWQGETVAVLASGPSMSAEVADALRGHRCIAVNYAVRLAPWAHMVVALDMDPDLDAALAEFDCLRVTGNVSEDLDGLYAGQWWERVRLAPNHEIEIRNSGLAAIRIAAAMGAARIILAGFNPESRGHFYDDEVDTGDRPDPYIGVAAGLAAMTAELQARGIVVERYVSGDGTGKALPEVPPSAYAPGAPDLPGNQVG
jgi:hypothetical protein